VQFTGDVSVIRGCGSTRPLFDKKNPHFLLMLVFRVTLPNYQPG
jgi:hypothetical protein